MKHHTITAPKPPTHTKEKTMKRTILTMLIAGLVLSVTSAAAQQPSSDTPNSKTCRFLGTNIPFLGTVLKCRPEPLPPVSPPSVGTADAQSGRNSIAGPGLANDGPQPVPFDEEPTVGPARDRFRTPYDGKD